MEHLPSRPLGIDILKEVPWGTHLCCFYESIEDYFDIVNPYLKTGLENNEFCTWVIPKCIEKEKAIDVLQKVVPDLQNYIRKNHLEYS